MTSTTSSCALSTRAADREFLYELLSGSTQELLIAANTRGKTLDDALHDRSQALLAFLPSRLALLRRRTLNAIHGLAGAWWGWRGWSWLMVLRSGRTDGSVRKGDALHVLFLARCAWEILKVAILAAFQVIRYTFRIDAVMSERRTKQRTRLCPKMAYIPSASADILAGLDLEQPILMYWKFKMAFHCSVVSAISRERWASSP